MTSTTGTTSATSYLMPGVIYYYPPKLGSWTSTVWIAVVPPSSERP